MRCASGGRYMSATPAGAAKKAFSQAMKNVTGRVASLEVHVRETTQGSDKKTYKYKVSRKKDPVTVLLKGQPVTFEYTVKVKAI
jgi:alkyl hydroperoxide reductase subunit AhpF